MPREIVFHTLKAELQSISAEWARATLPKIKLQVLRKSTPERRHRIKSDR